MTTITERALIERIRRKLAHDGLQFCTNRGGPYSEGLGKYYLVDANNGITGPHITSLEEYGRELGVMKENESLAG